jgi:hypothetical protein
MINYKNIGSIILMNIDTNKIIILIRLTTYQNPIKDNHNNI